MSTVVLQGEYITLAQALKVAGLVESGGEAKHTVREGNVRVNGAAEARPGRKLRAGDRFEFNGSEWTVTAPEA